MNRIHGTLVRRQIYVNLLPENMNGRYRAAIVLVDDVTILLKLVFKTLSVKVWTGYRQHGLMYC